MRLNLLSALTAFSLSLLGEFATCAEIRGTVTTPGGAATRPARYVTRNQNSQPSKTTSAGTVAIALEIIDQKPTMTSAETTYVMAQQNTTFVPNLLVVPLGAKVTFPNRDAFFHNVFSYSPPRSFDLGRFPKGETRTVRFEQSGIVRIFCEIHSSMFASILVSPSPFYQMISPEDGFAFPRLPAGKYRVIAVDAAGRKSKTDVTVAGDEVVELSLVLE